jgi:hypothetical protein
MAKIRSIDDVSPEMRREVQRRLRELERQCSEPKPAPAPPPERTDTENARHLRQLIAKAAEEERKFIVEVVGAALGEKTNEVAEEAAAHAEELVKTLERQLLELRTMFAQLLTNVAMMQARIIRDHGTTDLPELPEMRDVN